MRLISLLTVAAITIILIFFLDRPLGDVPPLGRLISPQHGFWQNAEPVDASFTDDLVFPELSGNTDVYFDERMVPHIFTDNETDAYFVQGWLHARFRLWQMEFQTHVAAGRLSEVLGAGPDSVYLNNDRNMRRLGMVYAAKNSLAAMEQDPETLAQINAYTAGINSWIDNLTQADLPLEYRLLNYYPEKWTNLKTALFLKYMSYDLTGSESDIEYTNARSFFSAEDFNKLYPFMADSASPIVPYGTAFAEASVKAIIPRQAGSQYFTFKDTGTIVTTKTDKDNGSNNWAVAGSKTQSGRPILCNDPHLGLNLPSLWYEMQITTPQFSSYGVSFPGAPSIIIGFNDHIAWGVTNAARDVKDFYAIDFRDDSQSEYRYNNEWKAAQQVTEEYLMKDGSRFTETVSYTHFGPVMYDKHFNGHGRTASPANLAVRWKAHEGTNELKAFYLLNRATNYDDYAKAISTFSCPGQNFVFASKSGDIAIWHQGSFPAKWKRQGDFVMPGTDSSYEWQADVPQSENPYVVNPARGFVSSANQIPADTTYPYYLGGSYDVYRGKLINRYLEQMSAINTDSMKRLQTENYNLLAETAMPLLMQYLELDHLSEQELRYLGMLSGWDKRNDPGSKGATVFTTWFGKLEELVWNDELSRLPGSYERPNSYTLIDALKKDSAFSFIDNISTLEKETLGQIVTASFQQAVEALLPAGRAGNLEWSRFKDAGIRHLLRREQLSRFHLSTGGGVNIINATKQFHGPSWRMIVHLTDEVEAYGIFPGGQSGNPGSVYYDDSVNDWAAGNYHTLWFMKKEDAFGDRVKHIIKFSKG